MKLTVNFAAFAAALLLHSLGLPADDFIWIEGENAIRHNMRGQAWYDSVNRDSLSGRNWLSHFAAGTPPEAEYQFPVTNPGNYSFWIRANPIAGAQLSYRLDQGGWQEIDMRQAVENINIAADGKPDIRFVAWINAGQLDLSAGEHKLAFRFSSKNNNHGGLDCFVLSTQPFQPRGILKPGQRTNKANPGFFAWEPDIDSFTEQALLDLRYLNEQIAGQRGRVTARDNGFVLGDGRPVKFWAVNIGGAIHELDAASRIYLARLLAKRGVNLVRIHGALYSQRDPAIDLEKLDNLHHFVWALKQEGIYSKLSFYFPAWFRLDEWHREGDRWPFTLLFFDTEMQRVYFRWADKLLATTNPYTGVSLGADPAVAIVEIQNEDSHLFWTFDNKNLPSARWSELESKFASWAKQRYGSIPAALRAWGGAKLDGDDPRGNGLELLSAWSMTRQGIDSAPERRQRISDQIRFLTENMRGFYEQAIDYFRDECGYGGLVSCGNWRTADPSVLGPLEQYCYTAGDVIDHHGYFDHAHQGQGSSWSVRPGHSFSSQSALNLRLSNPLPYVEVDGYPNIISEIGWPMPNTYRAEWPFLTAAYGSLTGLDAICHFSLHGAGWDQTVSKFPVATPVVLGSFFGAALVYRQHYVQEAPSVFQEYLSVEELLKLGGSDVFVRPAFDQLRAAQLPDDQLEQRSAAFDPSLFYVGRVTRSFGNLNRSSMAAPAPVGTDQVIVSTTQEIQLDVNRELVTIDTSKAQGACGFLGRAGVIGLADVDIDMQNDYGSVLVVALDDQPLTASKRILIQCMTVDQTYDWSTTEDGGTGGTIRGLGAAPWGVEQIDATVTLRVDDLSSAHVIACDENGYRVDKRTLTTAGHDSLRIQVNPTTPYLVVLR